MYLRKSASWNKDKPPKPPPPSELQSLVCVGSILMLNEAKKKNNNKKKNNIFRNLPHQMNRGGHCLLTSNKCWASRSGKNLLCSS